MDFMQYITTMIESGGVWLIPALISTLILMQGVKAVVKVLCGGLPTYLRKWVIFGLAFGVGYACGLYFLTGADKEKWAVMVGVINPILYFSLVQYAVARKKMVLLSILKMRPLKESGDGALTLDDTQVFFVGEKK